MLAFDGNTAERYQIDDHPMTLDAEGQHQVRITVDPDNQIAESNENNNVATSTIALQNLVDVLEAVSVPVLAIVGEDTFPGMAQAADAIAAAAPDGASERIAGAHHMWDPDAMVDRLALFLGLD